MSNRDELARDVMRAARSAQRRVHNMGPDGWRVDGANLKLTDDPTGRALGADRLYQALDLALLDTIIFASALRALVKEQYRGYDPEYVWEQRLEWGERLTRIRAKKVDAPKQGETREWLSATRYFNARRISSNVYICRGGQLTPDGAQYEGDVVRRRIEGWVNTVSAAGIWLGGGEVPVYPLNARHGPGRANSPKAMQTPITQAESTK